MDDKEGPPSAKALDEGYNQTYLIMRNDKAKEESKTEDNHDVFFRCGNWCYKGQIQFGGLALNTENLPVLIPLLQKQQGSLRYYCNAKSVPPASNYHDPLHFLEESCEFIGQEILSESVDKELRKVASVFPWIDDDAAATYFELALGSTPRFMDKVSMIASKTYTRGLIIISIYVEGAIYFILQPGEGDQALLDVRFPDVSQHGQGLHISSYNDHLVPYRKLTLWHVLGGSQAKKPPAEIPKIRTMNLSSKNYQQTYVILKSSWDNNSATLTVHHDALFRFGSWCYSGRVQLTPAISLADIPFVIPALRMQQSRMDYLCDVNAVPTTSPFAAALAYMQYITPLLEEQVRSSEDTLRDLVDRLTGMGLGDSVSKWLEGDPSNSFFEFKINPDAELSESFKNVELVVSKVYYASGIIAITIIYQHTVYVSLLENNGEAPLLDSRFPDVSGKGRGYQLQSYNAGDYEEWPTLRKVSIWQTVNALEQEFREKADALAQSKIGGTEGAAADEAAKYADLEGGSGEGEGEDELVVVNPRRNGSAGTGSKAEPEEDSKAAAVTKQRSGSGSGSPETDGAMLRAEEKGSPSSAAAVGGPGSGRERTGGDKVGAESGSSAAGGLGKAPTATALKPLGGGIASGARLTALPHHVPKMDSLASKLEDIRKNLGDEGLRAPWDARGKPLGGISAGKDSKK